MKRFHYNSWVAEFLLFFSYCEAITLGCFAFSKLGENEMGQEYRNHEATHMRQWTEFSVLFAVVFWLLSVILHISPWFGLIVPIVYYLWYGIEYLIRLCILRDTNKAYKSISFEQEAYENQYDDEYNTNSSYFAWTKFLFKNPSK